MLVVIWRDQSAGYATLPSALHTQDLSLTLLLATVACLWAIATSPVYVFPAIELFARYGGEIAEEHQDVYVTEPATIPIVQALLQLRGVEPSQVKVLPDENFVLDQQDIWILWSPNREKYYPNLMAALDKLNRPRHLYPLGISIPKNWSIVYSSPPRTITFLFTGNREDTAVSKQ